MPAQQLPPPERVTLANGKTRLIYRDFDGKIISKSQYDELKASGRKKPPPEERRPTFTLTFAEDKYPDPARQRLTPQILHDEVAPYLRAIADLQSVSDDVRVITPHEVYITSITQTSPISVNFEGGSEAVKAVQDTIVPWRRKHTKAMADLVEREKLAEIEKKKAETLKAHAEAERDRQEAARLRAEAERITEEAEGQRLENAKLRQELAQQEMRFILEVLEKLGGDLRSLPDAVKSALLARLASPLKVLTQGGVQMAPIALPEPHSRPTLPKQRG
jgi:hypothetical protein